MAAGQQGSQCNAILRHNLTGEMVSRSARPRVLTFFHAPQILPPVKPGNTMVPQDLGMRGKRQCQHRISDQWMVPVLQNHAGTGEALCALSANPFCIIIQLI